MDTLRYDSRSAVSVRRRSPVGMLCDLVVTIFSILLAVVLLSVYLAPYISPESSWIFSFLGLVAPVIYLAALAAMLYWVIRRRYVSASALLLLLLIGIPRISLYYKFDFARRYGERRFPKSALKVLNYNIRIFYDDNGRSSIDSIAAFISRYDPDILCLEEFSGLKSVRDQFDSLLGPGYYHRAYERDGGLSLAVYSRFRILGSGKIDCVGPSDTTRVAAMWADLRYGNDTIRVFCNHLRSTHIKYDDGEYLMQYRFLDDSTQHEKLRSMMARLRYNSIARASQVDTISSAIAASPHPVIVCGDFNDTPLSYTYRRMATGLRDAFRERGSGFSYTFRGFFNTFRIDYVLVSDAFEVLSYEVPEVVFSDHLPVFVRLKYQPKDRP